MEGAPPVGRCRCWRLRRGRIRGLHGWIRWLRWCAESAAPSGAVGMRETAVASAAALVAAQCAKVAEAAGATRDQVAAAVDAARASTDASNVITLTAAAATCTCSLTVTASLRHEEFQEFSEVICFAGHVTALRGAATLRGRRSSSGGHGQSERGDHAGSARSQDDLDFDFNHARSRAALAKGDELFVAMPDGECRRHAFPCQALHPCPRQPQPARETDVAFSWLCDGLQGNGSSTRCPRRRTSAARSCSGSRRRTWSWPSPTRKKVINTEQHPPCLACLIFLIS